MKGARNFSLTIHLHGLQQKPRANSGSLSILSHLWSLVFFINDQPCTDCRTVAGSFNSYFSSVFSRDNGTTADYACNFDRTSIPDITISSSGVHNMVLKLDMTKNSGADGIPNTVLRHNCKCCVRYLTVIFDKCLTSATLPILWNTANFLPLFKSANKQLIPNYRPFL